MRIAFLETFAMKLRTLLAATAATLALGSFTLPAQAQAPAAAPAQPPAAAPQTEMQPGQSRAKEVIDVDVYSSDGVEIGEVEDLILNAQNQVVLAVIEVESSLGWTEKYIIVPIQQLTPDPNNNDRATLPLTRDQIRSMPGFKYQN